MNIRLSAEKAIGKRKVVNFLDFESGGLPLQERLRLLEYAIKRAKGRARTDSEKQEFDFIERDCLTVITEMEHGEIDESDPSLRQRIDRMSRVVNHYEGRIVRMNRRYWWFFFLLGMGFMLSQLTTVAPLAFM